METTLYAFPSDLVDEGVDHVLQRIAGIGTDGVTIAVAYHRARDFCPRRRDGKLVYRDDGLFLPDDLLPDPGNGWPDGMGPGLQSDAERAAVAELLGPPSAHRYAWTVFLHNTTLGAARPDVTMRTAFGDSLRANLCPANPDVGSYADALARAVAATGMPVVAEALCYLPFLHGDHHERYFVELPDAVATLLGFCFCEHCDAAAAEGADPQRLAAEIRKYTDDVVNGRSAPIPADPATLADAIGEDLHAALRARASTVHELTRRVHGVVRDVGSELVFLDLTGAALGYDDGSPSGPPAAEQTWRLGIDPVALRDVVDGYATLAYARDPDRVAVDVRSYADALGNRTPLRVLLRPGVPDVGGPTDESPVRQDPGATNLAAKLQACQDAGAAAVDFYTYGMASEPDLDRIATVLAGHRKDP